MAELYEIKIDGVDNHLLVVKFAGSEAISKLYRFDITVSCADHDLKLEQTIAKSATFTMNLASGVRHVHGMVLSFELLSPGKTRSYYRLTLVPELWKGHKKREIRIFQDKDAGQIIDEVLGGAGLSISDHKMMIGGGYPKREYCVQYRESDWQFISRLMEEEGMFCYFLHAELNHTLVVGDSTSAYALVGDAVIFRPPAEAQAKTEHVSRFNFRHSVRPNAVTVTDYKFEQPSLGLHKTVGGSGPGGKIEVYDYPGNHFDPGIGQQRATVMLEQFKVAGAMGSGDSTCVRFAAGYVFNLSEHPHDYNHGYLLVEVRHHGAQPDQDDAAHGLDNYGNSFTCIKEEVAYRPEPVTPKPTIQGIQTAVVTGPTGEEIHTDEHGRVRVHFHWDRPGKKNETSSCWIRVSQVWAGAGWGAMHIPRIGQEVVVSFIEGDPDRPIITGRVYHGTNLPPYRLPAEKTKSTLKSDSTIGSGGSNELMFEDQKGKEEIYLHGQKDWTIKIENDKKQSVGHDEHLDVGHNRDKHVGGNQSEHVDGNKSITVKGAHTEKILLAEVITVGLASAHTIGGAFVESIGAAKQSTVAGASSESVGAMKVVKVIGNQSETVGGKSTESVGENKELTVAGKYQVDVTKDMAVSVKENADEKVDKNKSINVGEVYSLVVGSGKITVKKDGTIQVEGKDITIKGTGTINVEGNKLHVKSDSTVDVEASGAVKVKGSSIDLN